MRTRRFAVVFLITVSVFAPGSGRNVAAQQAQILNGILNVVWGDPRPGFPGGAQRFSLTTADGTDVVLAMNGHENDGLQFFGRSVTIAGRAATAAAAAAPAAGFIVDSIVAGPASAALTPMPFAVTGQRRVIFLLVKFQGDASPRAPSFYTDLANPDTPPGGAVFPATINGFFKKTSYNQMSWAAEVGGVGGLGAPGGFLTLPGTKAAYANCGWADTCANTTAIATDAYNLGVAQGINFSVYDNINFVLSNDLDCCAWGGSRTLGGKTYGTTWEPPWGQETDTYSHEMSHSIGLPHSGWVYYSYDSPFDTMSMHTWATANTCGSYFSANSNATATLYCPEPGGGYIGMHKDYLGWLPAGNVVSADTMSTSTTVLEALSLPLSSGKKLIRICLLGSSCDPAVSTARFFTVEARMKNMGATSQYDNGITGDGVFIHEIQRNRSAISGTCFFNSQSGWAVPVDATPGDYNSTGCDAGGRTYPNYALFNAQFQVGQTYVNSIDHFRVTVASRTSTTFTVTVTGDQFTDPTLTGGTTAIKAVHITELRTRINAQRSRFGLAAFSFTDPALAAGSTTIKAVHISELRQALQQAYTAAGRTPPTYTDNALSPNAFTIKRQHITELRAAVFSLEGS